MRGIEVHGFEFRIVFFGFARGIGGVGRRVGHGGEEEEKEVFWGEGFEGF